MTEPRNVATPRRNACGLAYLAFSRCHDPNSYGVVVRTGGDEGSVLIHSDHADPLSMASESLDAVSTHTNLGLVSQKASLN